MVGREGLTRAVLLRIVAEHGGEDPVSHLTTGNLAFRYPSRELPTFRRAVEDEIEAILGRREELYIRSVAKLKRMIDSDPFADAPFDNIQERCVSFARKKFPAVRLPVFSRRKDHAVFRFEGMQAYSVTRLVDGRTSGPGGTVERLLHGRVTTRSWNTVTKIVRKELA